MEDDKPTKHVLGTSPGGSSRILAYENSVQKGSIVVKSQYKKLGEWHDEHVIILSPGATAELARLLMNNVERNYLGHVVDCSCWSCTYDCGA